MEPGSVREKSKGKRNDMKKKCLNILLVMFIVSTVACIGIQDGGEGSGNSPTLGQELIDLMKARDIGAISHEEFKSLKAMLVAQYE